VFIFSSASSAVDEKPTVVIELASQDENIPEAAKLVFAQGARVRRGDQIGWQRPLLATSHL
jgi:hypothetical protein